MRKRAKGNDVGEKMEMYNSLFNLILTQASNEQNEDPSSDTLALQHLEVLAKMIGVSLDDSSLYRLAWGWSCKTPLCVTRIEFLTGMQQIGNSHVRGVVAERAPQREQAVLNVDPKFHSCLAAMRSFIEQTDEKIRSSCAQFRNFYRFIFGWVRAPETTARNVSEMGMSIETAVELWRMLIPEYTNFPHLEDWFTFCTTKSLFRRDAISRDLWEQFLEFTSLTRYDTYDVNDAWPSAIDDFVEWFKKKDNTDPTKQAV